MEADAIVLSFHPHPIHAVLFDLDGTLYNQARLRALMTAELLSLPLYGPMRAVRRVKTLAAYRRAQEHLRASGHEGAVAETQIQRAAEESRTEPAEVRRLVDDWMMTRPLKYLRWCRVAGVPELLQDLAARGVRAGVFSDYPATEKLRALGLADRFRPVLSAGNREIDAFKPSPRGFLRACDAWQLAPRHVLYVGDRPEVDAVGAAAAGMPCVIIGSDHGSSPDYLVVPSIERLRRVLDERR